MSEDTVSMKSVVCLCFCLESFYIANVSVYDEKANYPAGKEPECGDIR